VEAEYPNHRPLHLKQETHVTACPMAHHAPMTIIHIHAIYVKVAYVLIQQRIVQSFAQVPPVILLYSVLKLKCVVMR